MRKATMSFEEGRKALLKQMTQKAAKAAISKKTKFENSDVQEFLRKLDEFEEASLKSKLVFK